MPLEILDDKERLRSLKGMLHQFSTPAAEELIQRRDNGDIQCFACGHRCLVKPGRDGVCRVRFNENGTLLVPHGYVGALACDPIEKKPFFHVLPGSDALTFGMLGCDYHCGYCQNWVTSQMLRDPDAVAAPRHLFGRAWGAASATVKLEAGYDDATAGALARASHEIEWRTPKDCDLFGHAGALARNPKGAIAATHDPRSDGGPAGL